jgi:hypothetical protein
MPIAQRLIAVIRIFRLRILSGAAFRQYTTRPTGASPEAKPQESGRSRVEKERMTGIHGVRHCVLTYA